ncbi:hypothetical protein [Blastopirellula marina]|uniref:Carboxypeptidase regulatory-like domain-containing protein n=1 Tax=Blastopirellula marina DSM 3645 TaxID=314230 RepID=A3ZTR0_9BACT|nr:hypothetical protein [Blastopirellula marina]EAQ79962.1 hypothetical protein DSM3645_05050 [Blastopirellula marina DSM 3645]
MLRLSLLVAIFATPILTGCGASGPTYHTVAGRVTLDGQPIAAGRILLRDPTRQVGSVEAAIVDGRFEVKALPGPKRVEISAQKEVPLPGGKTNIEGDSTRFVEAVPTRYNKSSTLELIVAEDLENQDFELKSQP